MRSLWNRSGVLPLLAAGLMACDGTTDPQPVDVEDVLLDFCAGDTPVFFAHLNDRADWVRVLPDAQGTFAFQATPAFGLAIVRHSGGVITSEYLFTTPDDIAALNGASCIERSGTKSLGGSVADVPSGYGAVVTMANSGEIFEAPASAFTLAGLPNGPYDLIAHRELLGTSSVAPDRVIIRRAQDRTNGSTIPVLDFSAAEAVPTALHTVTANGLSSAELTEFLLTFSTPTTRRHSLSLIEPFTSPTRTLYGIPASLTQAGDLHELEVFADGGTAYRGEVQYYREPSSRTINLGAHLANPTLTLLPGSTRLQPRTQLPAQIEYRDLVSMTLRQADREVAVTATASFFGGTPSMWDLTVTDLTGMSGFPASASLQAGQNTDWFVDAYGGTGAIGAFLGKPTDGATLRFAGRSFVTSGSIAIGQAVAVRRDRRASLAPRSEPGGR